MLHFYKAELTDAATVAALINHCFRGEASRKGWTTAACCEQQMIAGKQTAHFGKIAVKPTLQNKGYGKDLIYAAEAMTKRE